VIHVACLNYEELQQLVLKSGSTPKELQYLKDSRGQGFEDSSEMLKNYKELKVWQKSLN
jgi:hypothetical protein